MAVCVFYAGNSRFDDFEKISRVITELAETENIEMFLVGEGNGFNAAVRRAFKYCEDNFKDISFLVLTETLGGCVDNLSSIYVQPAKNAEQPLTLKWLKNWLLLQADIIVTVNGFCDDGFNGKRVFEI